MRARPSGSRIPRAHARLAAATAATAGAWAVIRWARRHLRVVIVSGVSMLPSYKPGDLLTVRRIPGSAVRPGDVVVLHTGSPGKPQPFPACWIIKRVAAVPGDRAVPGTLPGDRHAAVPRGQLVLLGDNPAHSADSRQHGYFPASNVVGRVIASRRPGQRGPRPELTAPP